MKFDPLFFQTLNARTDPPGVVVVGDISRTWFSDQDLLLELYDAAFTMNEDAYLTVHGAFGFDYTMMRLAESLEIPLYHYAPEDHEERFSFHSGAGLVSASWMLLVFTRRKKPKEVYEIDPEVVETASTLNIPIFSVDEEGVVRAWP